MSGDRLSLKFFSRPDRKSFAQNSQHVRNAEGLLQLVKRRTGAVVFHQVSGHEYDLRLYPAMRSRNNLHRGFAPALPGSSAGKIHIAQRQIIGAIANELQRFLGTRSTVYMHAMSGEALLQQHANAFLVVQNQNRAAFQNIFHRNHRLRGRSNAIQVAIREFRWSNRQIDCECRPTRRQSFDIDGPAMLSHDRHANAQPKPGAATGPLGGVKRIEKLGQGLLRDAHAIVLHGDRNVPANAPNANLNASSLTNFANGVLSITDQIQENLDQLVGVADNRRQIGLRLKIHMNIVAPQRMILQLKRPLDQRIDVKRLFLRSSRPRELQQVLNDARGATGLAMRKLELALGIFLDAFAIPQEL